MPIDYNDQIHLLKDILQNQQEDCCGSVAECEQLERLVKSLMANANLDQQARAVLQEVYEYSQKGKYSSDLDLHIESNRQELSNWVNEIGKFS
mgnify:CR=1 FL=1|jgi:protein associated with RNAse G/E